MKKIKFYNIDLNFVDSLKKIIDDIKNDVSVLTNERTCTFNGTQSHNLMNHPLVKPKIDNILIQLELQDIFEYRWFHFVDYNIGGFQSEHTHAKTEDWSYILYLNNSVGGETGFVFGDYSIEIPPEKGKLILFPAEVLHYGNSVETQKTVAVGALIYKDKEV